MNTDDLHPPCSAGSFFLQALSYHRRQWKDSSQLQWQLDQALTAQESLLLCCHWTLPSSMTYVTPTTVVIVAAGHRAHRPH